MTIQYMEGNPDYNGDRFESLHSVHTITKDDKHLITLTGIVRLDIQGVSTKKWREEEVSIQPKIVYIPKDHALQIEHWAPFVTINAIYNKNQANEAGWAVNNFWIHLPADHLITYRVAFIDVRAKVLVRDSDGWLFRVAYQVTISGKLVDWVYVPDN